MRTIIVDLDNCISDDSWRLDRIEHGESNIHVRYHEYHIACLEDKFCNGHIFEQGHAVAILTSRPTTYMEATIQWLVTHGVKFDHMIMRNRYDYTESVALKRKMLWWLTKYYGVNHGDIICAYDDRQDIVNMYIEEGIRAEVLAIRQRGADKCV